MENKPAPPPSSDFGTEFITDALKLISGSMLAQIISLILSPVMTRLFLPEYFGVSAVFTSMVTIISVVACLRYELAIILAKDEAEAINLVWVCIILAGAIAGLLTPILFFLRVPLARLFQAPEFADFIWLTPITAFFGAIFLVFYNWFSRKRKYIKLSMASVAMEVSMDSIRLGTGFSSMASSTALIISNILGSFTGFLFLLINFLREDFKSALSHFSWQKIKIGVAKYKKFPLYNTWTSLLTNFSQQISIFMLSIFFDNTINGYYSLGTRVISLPVIMIANTIGQVFYQRAAKAKQEGGLATLVGSTFERLISFGLFPMLLLGIAGEGLFALLFGQKWIEAGTYVQILSIWFFFTLIGTPCNYLVNVFEKQEANLILNILIFVTRVISLLIGGLTHNIYTALWMFSVSGIVLMASYYFWITSTLGMPALKNLYAFLKSILISIPFLTIVAVPIWILHVSPLVIAILSILAGIGYYTITILRDNIIKQVIVSVLSKYKNKLKIKSSPHK